VNPNAVRSIPLASVPKRRRWDVARLADEVAAPTVAAPTHRAAAARA
jgi:hypothetical protein